MKRRQVTLVRRLGQSPHPPRITDVDLPLYAPGPPAKVALVQPGSYGDNINSTLLFEPLHAHWPGLRLDVYTSTLYSGAFANNPLIHHLYQFPASTKQEALHQLQTIPPLLLGRGYDHVLVPHPMINPDKWTSIQHGELGTNLICAWVRALEDLGVPYTLPLRTSLHLTPAEVARVQDFWNRLPHRPRTILMETHGESGQTFWNPRWTQGVGQFLCRNGDTNLLISRRENGPDVHDLAARFPGCVHFAGSLSLRECAEAFNRCWAFFSVSSGLSNVCNTSWCRPGVRWVEVTNSPAVTSAPIRSAGKHFWHEEDLDAFLRWLAQEGF